MAEMQMKIGYDIRSLRDPLPMLARANKIDLRKPLSDWGFWMLGRVDYTFEHQGREGVIWPKLAPGTLVARRARGNAKRKALDDTGAIRRSIRTATRGATQQVITSVNPLTAIHNSGAKIPAHTIRPVHGKALRFVIGAGPYGGGGKVVFAKKVEMPEVTIPGRPIAFITPRDEMKSLELMRRHVHDSLAGSQSK